MNKFITYLKCINCEKEYKVFEVKYTCPSCNNNLWVLYDYEKLKSIVNREYFKNNSIFSIKRYLPILPHTIYPFTLQIGWTPIYKLEKLASKLGIKELYFKDDTRNPSASLKDRASSIIVALGIELGVEIFTAASTGNAGCALACVCAAVGAKCVIFVPKNAPPAKLTQIAIFGAKLIKIDGTYDDAYDLSLEATKRFNWYCRSTGYNPYTREGKKTVSFEVCEQLNWNLPDYVFVPVGDGNIISGTYKGFYDFYQLNLIDKIPKIVGVQSEKSAAIYNTWNNYLKTNKIELKPVKATTIADSISVDIPRDGISAVKSVTNSNGFMITVSDEEIISAINEIAQNTGIFTEPAGATSYAGLKKSISIGKIKSTDTVLCLLTGSGLKDIKSVANIVEKIPTIQPNIKDLEEILKC